MRFYFQVMIFLNWKANGSKELINEYNALDIANHKVTPLPPLHLALLLNSSKFHIGSQDVSHFENGAHTGEVTAQMLEDSKVKFCLVGHSERRHYMGEDNAIIAKKIQKLCQHNITPILCVGENSLDRANNAHFEVLRSQLEVYTKDCIVAYEPVWAIGTGSVPSNHEIDSVADWIKQQYEVSSISPKVLYGGSVSSHSISAIAQTNVDGVLVGGASLKPDEVLAISKYF